MSGSGWKVDREMVLGLRKKIESARAPVEPLLAITIKTFLRPRSLLHSLLSIFNYPPNIPFRIHVIDDGPMTEGKKLVYEAIEEKGHLVHRFPLDTGPTVCRNRVIDKIDEDYILRMDDDFEFSQETSVDVMVRILEGRSSIGCVADQERQIGWGKGSLPGRISPLQGFLNIEDGLLLKQLKPPDRFKSIEIAGEPFSFCDYTRNFLLFRSEVFDDIAWEEDLHFKGEHEDLLLQLKESEWEVGFTPASIHRHNESLKGRIPKPIGGARRKDGLTEEERRDEVLYRKWGVSDIITEVPPRVRAEQLIVSVVRRIRHPLRRRDAGESMQAETDNG